MEKVTTHRSWPILVGAILAGMYSFFFASTLYASLTKGTWDAQISAAIFAAPASALILGIAHPALELVGGYESASRQSVVWALILVSGCLQYFLIGFGAIKLWYRINK